jgi:hypothetical protein
MQIYLVFSFPATGCFNTNHHQKTEEVLLQKDTKKRLPHNAGGIISQFSEYTATTAILSADVP